MKHLLHNIEISVMLVIIMAGIQACSEDWQEMENETIRFTAKIPTDVQTRSFGEGVRVNTLVVGVFNTQKEEIARKDFVINSSSIDVELSLSKDQTYSFVFWAYDCNSDIYDITDLTEIKMNALSEAITFEEAESADAFFAIEENITIIGNSNYPVELVRPLAQINVGTTGKPMLGSFTAKSVPDTFHPFTNTISGECDFTWNFSETTTETFLVESMEYNYLAMGYLFAPTSSMMITAELTLTDGQKSKTVEFSEVWIEANSRSNIAGGFTAE